MEIKEGMYVRTKCGLIAKIQSINEYNVALMNTCCERREDKYFTFPNEEKIYEIKKVSHNIIDLIEVGDFITYQYQNMHIGYPCRVHGKYTKGGKTILMVEDLELNQVTVTSIVTHEQFKSMEYIVKK